MDSAKLSEEVNGALGILESAHIDDLTIDMAHKKITIEATTHWGRPQHHTVTFEGVASFYAVSDAKEGRFDPAREDRFPGDTLIGDCDATNYFPEDVDGVRFRAVPGAWASNWAADFDTHPNFLISIGGYILLVEASQVRVNDAAFEVGYVRDTPPEAQ